MSTLDISTPTHPHLATAAQSHGRRPSLVSRLVARYVDGWTWYARSGFSPPAPEPGFPMRRPAASTASAVCPAPVVRRLAKPLCAPRFALLFGAGAGGR